MANRLFLVHGMGKHEAGWHQPVEALLREIYGRYRVARFVSFDDRFEVVPIGYDDIFRDLLARWQQDAATIGPLAEGVGAGQVENLVGWLRGVDQPRSSGEGRRDCQILCSRLRGLQGTGGGCGARQPCLRVLR